MATAALVLPIEPSTVPPSRASVSAVAASWKPTVAAAAARLVPVAAAAAGAPASKLLVYIGAYPPFSTCSRRASFDAVQRLVAALYSHAAASFLRPRPHSTSPHPPARPPPAHDHDESEPPSMEVDENGGGGDGVAADVDVDVDVDVEMDEGVDADLDVDVGVDVRVVLLTEHDSVFGPAMSLEQFSELQEWDHLLVPSTPLGHQVRDEFLGPKGHRGSPGLCISYLPVDLSPGEQREGVRGEARDKEMEMEEEAEEMGVEGGGEDEDEEQQRQQHGGGGEQVAEDGGQEHYSVAGSTPLASSWFGGAILMEASRRNV